MDLFNDEVAALEQRLQTAPEGSTLFYGSSSIRLWETLDTDFPTAQPLNLGFGGATLAACAWHGPRLLGQVRPRAMVLYAGDNDLGEGRQPEEVCLFFRDLAQTIQQFLPGVPVTFLSIKPSPARWALFDQIRLTNQLIATEISKLPDFQFVDATEAMLTQAGQANQALYQADGLHLNQAGYTRWRNVLIEQVELLTPLVILGTPA